MTAEIAVLNRIGVALAADSAVTSSIGEIDKISSSANKLFALSKSHPVGIMVYGSSLFMDVPWETIIKVYRSNSLPEQGFPTLEEYAKHFISFLRYDNINFPNVVEDNYIWYFALSLLDEIKKNIISQLERNTTDSQGVGENVIKRLMDKISTNAYNYYLNQNSIYFPLERSKKLMRKYGKRFQQAIEATFNDFPITKEFSAKVKNVLAVAFSKSIREEISSGVVIAGFGEKEFLPTIRAFKIEGIVKTQSDDPSSEILKYSVDEAGSTDSNMNAAVVPYAQQDMACRFMEGVDPQYKVVQNELLSVLFKDYAGKVASQLGKYNDGEKRKIRQKLITYGNRMVREFDNNMGKFARESFIDPTVLAVGRLTKDELAAMAEALVYVTSLKEKFHQILKL